MTAAKPVLIALLCLLNATADPQVRGRTGDAKRTPHTPGTSSAVQQELARPFRWSGTGAAVAVLLRQWQSQTGIPVITDRRVDHQKELTINTGTSSAGQVLGQICENVSGTEWSVVDRFVYVGPAGAVGRLELLLELQRDRLTGLRRRLPSGVFRRLVTAEALEWERLSEPRTILESAAERHGIRIENPDLIPHDLWDAAVWPRMAFPEMATVILNQFDLVLVPAADADGREIDGTMAGTFRVQPLDLSETMERSYAIGREHRESVTDLLSKRIPGADPQWSGGTLRLTASLEQHLWLTGLQRQLVPPVSPEPRVQNPDSLKTRRFTLEVEGTTLGKLIDHFRGSGIVVELSGGDQNSRQQLLLREVRLNLKSLEGTEFFQQTFGPHVAEVTVLDDRVLLVLPP